MIKVKITSNLSFEFWEQLCKPKESNFENIKQEIEQRKLSLSNLPEDIKEKIWDLAGKQIQISSLKNFDMLENFIETEKA